MSDEKQLPEPTLRDDLRSAVESLKENPSVSEDIGKISDAERARDDAGRFAAKDKDAEPKRPVLTLPDKAKPADTAQPQASRHKPPDGWTAPMKERFATLPEDVQAEITRRESEAHKRISSNDEERTFGRQFREALAPYQAVLTSEGAQPIDAFKQFLNVAYIMRTGSPQQKLQALQQTAQAYNVPLGQLLQQQPAVDPRVENLQQQMARIERERQAEIQQRQAQESQAINAEIEAFAASPGHEHYEAVKLRMGHLLESGLAKDLQDAYDQAVWSDPATRSTLASANAQSEAEKRATEQKARADAAKRAAGSVTGAPGGAKPLSNGAADPSRDLRDEIRANLRAATGRV